MLAQQAAGLAKSLHHLKHTFGQPGLCSTSRSLMAVSGVRSAGLEDHCIPASEGRRGFPTRDLQRIVPGADSGDHTHRLPPCIAESRGPRSRCSPASVGATPAKYSRQSAPEITSTTLVSWIGLPVSRVSSSASSVLRARSMSAARRRIRPRSVPVSAAHSFCARVALRQRHRLSDRRRHLDQSPALRPWPGLIVSKVSRARITGRRLRGTDSCAILLQLGASTNAVNSARALSLSASSQSDSAARNQTPSIIAAIIEARLRASGTATSRSNACRKFDNIRR